MMDAKRHTICLMEDKPHRLDAHLVSCEKCGTHVWVDLNDMDKIPVCISCAVELIYSGAITIQTQFNKDDIKEFFAFLLKKQLKA